MNSFNDLIKEVNEYYNLEKWEYNIFDDMGITNHEILLWVYDRNNILHCWSYRVSDIELDFIIDSKIFFKTIYDKFARDYEDSCN